MNIFLLGSVAPEIILDESHSDLCDIILIGGEPYATLEGAIQGAQEEINSFLTSFGEEADSVRPSFEKLENPSEFGGCQTLAAWKAKVDVDGPLEFVIREVELGS